MTGPCGKFTSAGLAAPQRVWGPKGTRRGAGVFQHPSIPRRTLHRRQRSPRDHHPAPKRKAAPARSARILNINGKCFARGASPETSEGGLCNTPLYNDMA